MVLWSGVELSPPSTLFLRRAVSQREVNRIIVLENAAKVGKQERSLAWSNLRKNVLHCRSPWGLDYEDSPCECVSTPLPGFWKLAKHQDHFRRRLLFKRERVNLGHLGAEYQVVKDKQNAEWAVKEEKRLEEMQAVMKENSVDPSNLDIGMERSMSVINAKDETCRHGCIYGLRWQY